MENPEVARIFEEVADLLELQGENPFRIRAYRNAARTVNDLGETVSHIVQECPQKLTELPGIGKDLAGKITTIVETGDPARKPKRIELNSSRLCAKPHNASQRQRCFPGLIRRSGSRTSMGELGTTFVALKG